MCWIHRGLQGIALKRSAQYKIPKRRYRDQKTTTTITSTHQLATDPKKKTPERPKRNKTSKG